MNALNVDISVAGKVLLHVPRLNSLSDDPFQETTNSTLVLSSQIRSKIE